MRQAPVPPLTALQAAIYQDLLAQKPQMQPIKNQQIRRYGVLDGLLGLLLVIAWGEHWLLSQEPAMGSLTNLRWLLIGLTIFCGGLIGYTAWKLAPHVGDRSYQQYANQLAAEVADQLADGTATSQAYTLTRVDTDTYQITGADLRHNVWTKVTEIHCCETSLVGLKLIWMATTNRRNRKHTNGFVIFYATEAAATAFEGIN
ncbi:hypothetical protein [Lactiplantibacillus daowaiensis]|uniref:Uncharacterized protein n=1 Tax=Lactiplantibacillus daowaiensis TaxID=2559918 RepID=A0ABW1S2H3_9LACO